MSKVREVERDVRIALVPAERVIIVIGNSGKPFEDGIITMIVPVNPGEPLPDLGRRVILIDEHRMVKFAGVVTDVDFENCRYTIKVRKTAVEILQEEAEELTPLPGPVRRVL